MPDNIPPLSSSIFTQEPNEGQVALTSPAHPLPNTHSRAEFDEIVRIAKEESSKKFAINFKKNMLPIRPGTGSAARFPDSNRSTKDSPDVTAVPSFSKINPHRRAANKLPKPLAPTRGVQRGFGNFLIEDQSSVLEPRPRMHTNSKARVDNDRSFLASNITTPAVVVSFQHDDGREFPPLSNKAYDDSAHPFTRNSFKPSLDGLAFIKEQLHQQKSQNGEKCSTSPDTKNFGEKVAQNISWNRPYYNGGEMGLPTTSGLSPESRATQSSSRSQNVSRHPESTRQIFVDMINDKGEEGFQLCSRCMKRHIPFGPPLTLHDRDTCVSQLPEWFPKDRFDKPWERYTDLVNESVKLEEIKQGRRRDPMKPVWDKEYHSPTQAWRDVCRYGGWWKCRTGKKPGETNVPFVEMACRWCHAPKSPSTKALHQEKEMEKEEYNRTKQNVPTFIKDCVKKQMKKDRAFVEARWKTEGI